MKLNYEKGQMEWFDSCIPMRAHSGLTSVNFDDMSDNYFIQLEDTIFGEDWLDSFATEILDAKYELTDVASVVNTLDHLTQKQKDDILNVLTKHKKCLMEL